MFETVVIQCSKGFVVHEAHSWRHGFLNLRKSTCDGITQVGYDKLMTVVTDCDMRLTPKKVEHKCKFTYKPSQKHLWVNPDRYVWICKTQSCNAVISSDKEEFRGALLHAGRAYAKKTVIYRKPWK